MHAASRHRLVPLYLADVPHPAADVHETVVRRLEAARVVKAVRALPPLERLVVGATYGLDARAEPAWALAARLGVRTETVEAVLERALARLRGDLAAELEVAA